jgi:hypothetical protein
MNGNNSFYFAPIDPYAEADLSPIVSSAVTRFGMGEFVPVYWNQTQCRLIRNVGRRLAVSNEYAVCAINNRVNYIVGKGFQFIVRHPNRTIAAKAQRIVDYFLESNHFDALSRECVYRDMVEGEFFLRIEYDDAVILKTRFIEPEFIYSPIDGISSNSSFGVVSEWSDPSDVKGYLQVERSSGEMGLNWSRPSFLNPMYIVHFKDRVPANAKRGVSMLYPIEKNLQRCEDLTRALVETAKNRAKIGLIRHFEGVSGEKVKNTIDGRSIGTVTDERYGSSYKMEQLPFGSIINSTGNVTYEFPQMGANAVDFLEVLKADLRACAASLGMPEYMLTADASNSNYASTLVAEAPAVKGFESVQAEYLKVFASNRLGTKKSLLWRQLEWAMLNGQLNQDDLEDMRIEGVASGISTSDTDKEASRHKIYFDMGILDKDTIRRELGYE